MKRLPAPPAVRHGSYTLNFDQRAWFVDTMKTPYRVVQTNVDVPSRRVRRGQQR